MDYNKSENKETQIYELMKINEKIISILSPLMEAISDIYKRINQSNLDFLENANLQKKHDNLINVMMKKYAEISEKGIENEGLKNEILRLKTEIIKLSLFDQFFYLVSISEIFGRMNIKPRELEDIAFDPAYRRNIVDFADKHDIDVNEYLIKKGMRPLIQPAEIISFDEYSEKEDE